MAFVKLTPEMAAQAVRETDWARLDALTDEEIEAAVASDPDAAPIRSAEAITAARIAAIRARTGLTREAFAHAYGIPLDALSLWEEAKAMPDETARSYLRVIEREPYIVARTLAA